LLGPVAGIMIADYFLLRRLQLNISELYQREGVYEYRGGYNLRALIALAGGVIIALVGLVFPPLRWLYDYAWFVGFFVSGLVYLALMRAQERGSQPQAEPPSQYVPEV
jgi:nucleobase:cation symporter-1, NCS1 family